MIISVFCQHRKQVAGKNYLLHQFHAQYLIHVNDMAVIERLFINDSVLYNDNDINNGVLTSMDPRNIQI